MVASGLKVRRAKLFGAESEDLLVVDLNFYAEGRAHIAALDDGATNPDVAGKAGGFHRVVERVAARIANERMTGGAKIVITAKDVEIADIFELASAVRGFARERPIATGEIRRAGRKADDGSGDVVAGGQIVDKKVSGRPGLGKIGDAGDDWIVAVRMREKGIRVGRSRRHLELRSGLDPSGTHRTIVGKPADGKEKHESQRGDTNDQRKKGIGATNTGSRRAHAGDLRHIGFKARR